MKKSSLLLAFFFCFCKVYFAQIEPIPTHTVSLPNDEAKPNSFLWDRFGNPFTLDQLKILDAAGSPVIGGKAIPSTSCQAGFFNIYYTPTSGMAGSTPAEILRRNVICQVYTDISNLIATPLNTLAGTPKVNIVIEDIVPLYPNTNMATSSILASATAYQQEASIVNVNGIMHNVVWKAIHLGNDPYSAPFYQQTSLPNALHYHASMAFNFLNGVNINYDLTSTFILPNQTDFYTLVLHEAAHILGIESQISGNGFSFANSAYPLSNFNYYSNYDRFLKDHLNNNLITNGSSL